MSFIRLTAICAAAMAAQWWWMTYFSPFGLAPQLLLVLTVALAARHGALWGMTWGFLWGLFLDMLNPQLFGANALILTWIAYGTGSVRRQIDVAGLGPQVIVVMAMTWAYFLGLGLLGRIFSTGFYWVGAPSFFFDPFYNAVVAALVYAVWVPQREYRR